MAIVQPLINLSELKTGYLKANKEMLKRPLIHFDKDLDELMILFVLPKVETVVHYVDEFVALLYKPDDFEIVGIQIDDFETEFLPKYAGVAKAWKLSDKCKELNDIWDFELTANRIKPLFVKEILKASKLMIGKPAEEFVRVFEYVN